MTTKHIGFRIKKARQINGMTQADLADTLDSNVSCISAWETGRVVISSMQLYEIAKKLDLPINYFFEGYVEDKSYTKKFNSILAEMLEPNESLLSPLYNIMRLKRK